MNEQPREGAGSAGMQAAPAPLTQQEEPMAKNYTIGWKPFKTELDGDEVTMELLPLSRAAMFAIQPVFAFDKDEVIVRSEKRAAEKNIDFKDALNEILEEDPKVGRAYQNKASRWANDLVEAAKPYLIERVRNIDGFLINGAPPAIEMLIDQVVFTPLLVEIINELVKRSSLKGTEIKN